MNYFTSQEFEFAYTTFIFYFISKEFNLQILFALDVPTNFENEIQIEICISKFKFLTSKMNSNHILFLTFCNYLLILNCLSGQ